MIFNTYDDSVYIISYLFVCMCVHTHMMFWWFADTLYENNLLNANIQIFVYKGPVYTLT